MATTETVTLSVEVEEKFRVSVTGTYYFQAGRTVSSDLNLPERLIGWVDTYASAYDNGVKLMALYEEITGFSVIKEYRRAVPVAEPGMDQ